jgi:hypothetical protein
MIFALLSLRLVKAELSDRLLIVSPYWTRVEESFEEQFEVLQLVALYFKESET